MEPEVFFTPIKFKKFNIGTNDNPKMEIIRDYWDEKIVERITKLLCEYNDMFPLTFIEMKGISGEIGEMNTPLKPKARPIK
jgi:hypothetical protein